MDKLEHFKPLPNGDPLFWGEVFKDSQAAPGAYDSMTPAQRAILASAVKLAFQRGRLEIAELVGRALAGSRA